MITKNAIQLKQNGLTFYLMKLTGQELLDYTKIEHFNSSKAIESNEPIGYQRPPYPAHYRKISKYLLGDNAILPPAIICAIDSNMIRFDNNEISIKDKVRVVDGQHRIEGIRHLPHFSEEKYSKVKEYEFGIILMSIGKEDKIYEVTTFIDLNKKGKKVSTDLAISLAEVLRKQDKNTTNQSYDDLVRSIATNISKSLESNPNTIWYKSISLGDEITRKKPVSINLFNRSLTSLIIEFLKYKGVTKKNYTLQDFNIIDYSKELMKLINEAWLYIIERWPKCFTSVSKPGYSEKYNIQKGIGVYSIHILLTQSFTESKGNIDQALAYFKDIIHQSKLTQIDWKTGGRFSVYNSKSGFEKIAKIIKNEIESSEDENEELLF
ncbi:DGQHR domain-containing protein [Priestia aryabhattai]|uniref:DGQHR domain-containing protein n=1 Tax=Priestia aryabhattai TaxID=412384 RepID=A0AAX6N5Q6_PRIAR|nr:DGQHR domain-containing protein [Priestia aryabhattai]MDU9691129.1 DGQHR domain-containing protein [Priestia aryabhattai]